MIKICWVLCKLLFFILMWVMGIYLLFTQQGVSILLNAIVLMLFGVIGFLVCVFNNFYKKFYKTGGSKR